MRTSTNLIRIMLVLAFVNGHLRRVKKVFKSINIMCALNKDLEELQPM